MADSLINQVVDGEIATRVAPAIMPIVARFMGLQQQVGSSFVLRTNDALHLVTAAHVFDDGDDFEVWGDEGRLSLDPADACVSACLTNGANPDLASFPLTDRDMGRLGVLEPLVLSHLPNLRTLSHGGVLIALGLPWRKGNMAKKGTGLHGRMMILTGNVLAADHLPKAADLDSTIHAPIEFNRRRVRDRNDQQITAPLLEGMSGGPIVLPHWIDEARGSYRVDPVGVLIQYHETGPKKVIIMAWLDQFMGTNTQHQL